MMRRRNFLKALSFSAMIPSLPFAFSGDDDGVQLPDVVTPELKRLIAPYGKGCSISRE